MTSEYERHHRGLAEDWLARAEGSEVITPQTAATIAATHATLALLAAIASQNKAAGRRAQ